MARIRFPVNRFRDFDLRSALTIVEEALNELEGRFTNILSQSLGQRQPPVIPSSSLDTTPPAFTFGTSATLGSSAQTVRANAQIALFNTATPAAVSLSAGAVGTSGKAARADHAHLLTDGAGSGLDADTVDGIEGASFLRSDADDTGTGAYTLSHATTPIILSGATPVINASAGVLKLQGTETVVLQDSAGTSKITVGSGGTDLLLAEIPSGASIANILSFTAAPSYAGVAYGISTSVANAGAGSGITKKGGGVGMSASVSTSVVAGAAGSSPLVGYDLRGLTYPDTSNWGQRAADRMVAYAAKMTFSDNHAVVSSPHASGGVYGAGVLIAVDGAVGWPLSKWAGIMVDTPPVSYLGDEPVLHVGIACEDHMAISAGRKLFFDSSIAVTHGGSITAPGATFSYTEGDTYLSYTSASTQLDVYVDGAQAAHFDAGGAAGTSRIYGALTLDADLDHDGSNIGFFATSPAAQASATDDIKDALTTYGLLQGTSATPLDTDGGDVTCGDLNVEDSLRVTDIISPAQLTADVDDYAPTGYATAVVFRLSSDASRNISGLQGGADGRLIIAINVGSNDITISHDDVASTAANRFYTPTAATVTLGARASSWIHYDGTSSRWRVLQ